MFNPGKFIAPSISVAAFALLSACGGSTTGGGTAGAFGFASTPTTAEALQIGQLAVDDFERILGDGFTPGIPGTAYGPLNATTTGSATYTGPGSVSIFSREVSNSGGFTTITDTEVVGMLGTSRVTFDFQSDTFAGQITDLFAVDGTTFDTDLVSGEITIANGSQADLPATPTFLEANATGTVEAFGETYSVDVPLEGFLRGTNPNAPDNIPVRAISLVGEGTVTGSTLLVDIVSVGDKDAANNGAYVNR